MGKLHSKNKQPTPPPKMPTAIEVRTWIGGAQAKMSLFRSKKVNEIRAKKKEVIELLKQNNLDVAKTKMDNIIQAEDIITLYDILIPQCEVLKERSTYLLSFENVPADVKDTLDTLIYASNRLEVEELHKLREMMRLKYGDVYLMAADTNKDGKVNVNVVEKLKIKPNSDALLVVRLKQIVAESKIDFTFPPEFEFYSNNEPNFNEQQNMNMNPYMDNNNNNNMMMNNQMGQGDFNPYMNNMPPQNFNNNYNPYSNNNNNNPYCNNNSMMNNSNIPNNPYNNSFNQSNIDYQQNANNNNENNFGFQQMPPNNNFNNQPMPQSQMQNNPPMQFPQRTAQNVLGDFPKSQPQQPNNANNSYANFNPYKEEPKANVSQPTLAASNVEFNKDFSHLHKMDGFPTNQATNVEPEPKKKEETKDENEELSKKISELHLGDTYINDSPTVSRIEDENKDKKDEEP